MKLHWMIPLFLSSLASAFDFQLGGYGSDHPGAYLDFRIPIRRAFLGLGASEGLIDVVSVDETSIADTDPEGNPLYRTVITAGEVGASLHAIEAFGGIDLLRRETFAFQASAGIGYALLDGTEGGQSDRSRDMITIPFRLEGIWTPKVWASVPGLGLASGIGLEWRRGIDKSELYREMDDLVFKMRIGLAL